MTLPAISTPTNARSRRTRDDLLTAAREIVEHDGAAALTMASVAAQAGVTRRTAYLHFGTRATLIGALFDHLAAAEGLEESLDRVWSAPDAVAALDAWAAHLADYHPRLLAIDRAVEDARHRDPDAAAHRRRVMTEKMRNCRRLARRLDRDGQLATEWTVESATDMLFALISSDMIEALVVDRRWSRARLATQLAIVFRHIFLRPGAYPAPDTVVSG
jgi:AcrR family transcriptional regulator